MPSSRILLLTNTFPYGNREPFLETELKYLCQEFENIEIVPVYATMKMIEAFPRDLPENASINKGAVMKIRAERVSISNRLTGLFRNKGILFHIRNEYSKVFFSLKRFLTLSKFISNTSAISMTLNNILETGGEYSLYYSYWLNPAALALISLKRLYPYIICISRVHRGDLYEEENNGYLPFQKLMLENLNMTYVISQDGKNYLSVKYPELKNRLSVSRLGVRRQSQLSRQSTDGVFRLVSCSAMVPVKRLHLLVNALKQETITIIWTHIGTGDEMMRIQSLVKELPSQIRGILLGRLSNTDVLNFYASNPVDLFVNVSRSEGVPVSIMEALSFGIPVLATAVGGTSELVDESNGGLLVKDCSSAQIANALHEFYSLSNIEKNKKRNAARRTWEQKCDAELTYTSFSHELKALSR